MGTTLAGLHIFTDDIESVRVLCGDRYAAYAISEGWVSVIGDDMGTVEKEVKTISTSMNALVLEFLYFDDDLIAVKLFQNGKKAAHYEMTYAGESYMKNLRTFISAFGFEASQEKRLRKIFKCSDIAQKVAMLEEFFGVALYIHPEFIQDGTESYTRKRGGLIYLEYEAQQQKLRRIKNRMKAVLMQETDAKIAYNSGLSDTFFLETHRNDEGIYSPDSGTLIELSGDTFRTIADGIPVFGSKLVEKRDYVFIEIPINKCLSVSKNGSIIKEYKLPDNSSYFSDVIENGDLICINNVQVEDKPAGRVFRFTETGDIVWSFEFKEQDIWISPVVFDRHIYFGTRFDNEDSGGELYKLDFEGRIISSREIPYIRNNSEILFLNDSMFYMGQHAEEDRNVFMKLDLDLNVLDMVYLPKSIHIIWSGLVDSRLHRIYYSITGNEICIINYENLTYEFRSIQLDFEMAAIDEDSNIFGCSNPSTLCVLNSELELISRHRLKGEIRSICQTDTEFHVVTGTGDTSAWGFVEPPCTLRVYSVDSAQ